jgi:hypothetical protein
MSRESAPQEQGPKETLAEFYKYVAEEIPDGLTGEEDAYPVKLGDLKFNAVLFGIIEGKATFGLFIDDGAYSRKTLEVDQSGEVTEDRVGIIPASDLSEEEPDFSAFTNEEIALSVIRQIKSYKRPNIN